MTPDELIDLVPPDTPPYMAQAYFDCLVWAIRNPDILAAFRAETGNNWTPGKTPIERMVDDATGVGEDFVKQFIPWFNLNVWGSIDAPEGDA